MNVQIECYGNLVSNRPLFNYDMISSDSLLPELSITDHISDLFSFLLVAETMCGQINTAVQLLLFFVALKTTHFLYLCEKC